MTVTDISSVVNPARRRVLQAAGALAVLSTGLTACGKSSFHATDVTGADIGKGWALPDLAGNMRSAQDYAGKVAVVFFCFIQCPDVCPVTLAHLTQVKEKLGSQADRMEVLFITVDPERDTPEIMQAYLSGFDPSFTGLRGEPEQLATVAKSFKSFYSKVPLPGTDSYTMEHSAGLYIFDTKGAVRLYTSQSSATDELAEDIRKLL